MSRVLFLEPIGGIAGDMFLAAALDLGVSQAALEAALAPLKPLGWRFEVSKASRHSIAGTHVDVVLESDHHPDHGHDHGHGRAWREIRALIEASALDPTVKADSLAVFGKLAAAEAQAHGVPEDEVHFHEVGGVDAMVDIVGAACVLKLLGNPKVYAAPPPMGSGVGRSMHGAIPIPGPATLALLQGRPVKFEGVGETTTPTGAAILAALTDPAPPPAFTPEKLGFGVGTKDFADRPNLLRMTLGTVAEAVASNALWVLEANLDDSSPQLFARLFERLFEAGALDVWATPALMKKARPAQVLSVLAESSRRPALEQVLFLESTTLGVRAHPVERAALSRRFETVQTPYGPVRIKLGERSGQVLNAAPEYEDALACAKASSAPLKDVLAAAVAAWRMRG